MGEGSAIVWAAFITGFGGLILGVYTTWATRRKGDAEANAITSTEWRKLYNEMCNVIKELRNEIVCLTMRINKQDKKIDKQGHELDLYKDTVQYLWLGILTLTRQLESEGMIPEFKPRLNFRGDDDFDKDDWKWLEEK